MNFFEGKDILVTGGCGSIGSEIVKQLLDYNPTRLRILDHNESGQFHLEEELRNYKNHDKTRFLIGDVRDKDRLKRAIRDVDIVFHAAALKHVPLCEYNPFEAVETNVLGTQNLIDVSRSEGVDKFLFISTDKAVNPINTMGATKLLSEKLVINADMGIYKTRFSCVRFGNVLNSDGSVIPIFRRQIKKGGPVTITSRDMTRFFMSMPEAVNLVLNAMKSMDGREIFILKMNKIRIIDLVDVLIEELAPRYGRKPDDIKVVEIGRRSGEKLYEMLLTEEEAQHVEDGGDMFVLRPPANTPNSPSMEPPPKPLNIREYSSKVPELLCKEKIRELLHEKNILGD